MAWQKVNYKRARKGYSRYRRRQRRMRNGYYRSRHPTYGQIFSKLYHDVGVLKRYVNTEKKVIDNNLTLVPNNTVGTVSCLNAVAQGDGNNQRDGSSIKMLSVQLKGDITIDSLATRSRVRVLLLLTHDADGAIPTLSAGTGQVLSALDIYAYYNKDTIHKFNILWDHTWCLDSDARDRVKFNKYFKLSQKVRYDGTGGANTDLSKNAIYCLFLSDEGANIPSIHMLTRMTFVDN